MLLEAVGFIAETSKHDRWRVTFGWACDITSLSFRCNDVWMWPFVGPDVGPKIQKHMPRQLTICHRYQWYVLKYHPTEKLQQIATYAHWNVKTLPFLADVAESLRNIPPCYVAMRQNVFYVLLHLSLLLLG